MLQETLDAIRTPLFFARSNASTESNHTGSWSFIQPAYGERTAPCSAACPCGTDIPRVEALAAAGQYGAAWRTILMENPLPGVCGRVCFHPCERACNRGELDGPVAINAMERFLADQAERDEASARLVPAAPRGRKVALIGSGPAGLSAAYFLARLGYACEIHEAEPEPGGILRWGIPAYRLPAAVLAREIDRLRALGVRITCDAAWDARFPEGSCDAILVACGRSRPLGLALPGGELARDGLALLRAVRGGRAGAAGAGVAAVIGGGNSAIDVARTLLRRGMQPLIIYRRRREDMPAFAHEVERALAEGVRLLELSAPLGLSRSAGGLGIELQKMRSTDPGPDGRARVEAIPGATTRMEVAEVYGAIGAEAEAGWRKLAQAAPGLQLAHSRIAFGPVPLAFVGDLSTAENSVPEAIASGKEAALALDACFQGGREAVAQRLAGCRIGAQGPLSMELYLGGERARRAAKLVAFADINAGYFPPRARVQPAALAVRASAHSFAEVAAGLTFREAGAEAERCFNCGICNGCDNCRTFCPDAAVKLEGAGRRIDLEYCKGCGVCVEECPRGAMAMGTEGERR